MNLRKIFLLDPHSHQHHSLVFFIAIFTHWTFIEDGAHTHSNTRHNHVIEAKEFF